MNTGGRQCRACTQPTSGYSTYCNSHKKALQRHGHAQQEGVTARELAPYIRRVRTRMKKNPDSPVWRILEERWTVLAEMARAATATHAAGRTYQKHERRAWLDVLKLDTELGDEAADKVMTAALGMALMQADQPRRFKSDKAFMCQVGRRVRGLVEANVGTVWDHKQQRVKRYYKETPAAVLETLGQWVMELFGAAGGHLAAMEQRERELEMNKKQAMDEALEALV